MGRIVVSQFVTVDGVIEDPGGSEGMERGGWAFQFNRGEDGDKFKLDEVMESSALLLGRKTYEGFAAAWPSREGDFADKFNTMPKYVVSSTLSDPSGRTRRSRTGDLAKLKEERTASSSSTGAGASWTSRRPGPRGRVPADGLPDRPREGRSSSGTRARRRRSSRRIAAGHHEACSSWSKPR